LNRVREEVIERLAGPIAGAKAMPSEEPSTFEEREKIVLSLMMEGMSGGQIAETLGVSSATVGVIIRAIIRKLREMPLD
jgi:DNA-binding NarL/FixJ family response regulator